MKKEIGKYLIDVSKLIFGGIVLTMVLELQISKPIVVLMGITATIVLAIAGFLLIKKTRKND